MTAAPRLIPPTYIDALPPAEAAPVIKAGAGQLADQAAALCRRAPGPSLLGATLLGVTAAYFVPKALDWFFDQLAAHELAGDDLAGDDLAEFEDG